MNQSKGTKQRLAAGILSGSFLLLAGIGSAFGALCEGTDTWETSDGYVCSGNRAVVASGVDGPTGNKAVGISLEDGTQAEIWGQDNNEDISGCYAKDTTENGTSATDTNGGCGLADEIHYKVFY